MLNQLSVRGPLNSSTYCTGRWQTHNCSTAKILWCTPQDTSLRCQEVRLAMMKFGISRWSSSTAVHALHGALYWRNKVAVLCFRFYKEYKICCNRQLFKYACDKIIKTELGLTKIIAKIKRCSFLTHTVDNTYIVILYALNRRPKRVISNAGSEY